MPDPTTIRRVLPEALGAVLDARWRELEVFLVLVGGRYDFMAELRAAFAQRQREAVREALMWGDHDRECARRRIVPATSKPGPCDCGFDEALDRLAPKEGW